MRLHVGDLEDDLGGAGRGGEEIELEVEGLGAEELVDEGLQDLVVELVVDLAAENRLPDQGS